MGYTNNNQNRIEYWQSKYFSSVFYNNDFDQILEALFALWKLGEKGLVGQEK